MPDFDENDIAIRRARRLIEGGQYVRTSDWSEARPSPADEDAFLAENSWEEYSAWHLGVDGDAQYDTKERCGFLTGDFRQVHRSALVHAMLHAERDGHTAVKRAAEDLLRRGDRLAGG